MSTIFKGSTETLSAPRTSRIIEPLFRWLFPGITPDALSTAHLVIRKGGHVTAYAILAALFWLAFSSISRLTLEARVRLTLLCCILYAASDEFHQSFHPSRGASLADVMFDAAGAILGLSIILAVRKFRLGRSTLAAEP